MKFTTKTIILFVVVSAGYWFWANRNETTPTVEPIKTEVAEKTETDNFPMIDLPLNYFSVDDIRTGSAGGKGKDGTMEFYTEVSLDNKTNYQSYPTTNVTIKDFSNEVVPITSKKFADVIVEVQKSEGDSWGVSFAKRDFGKYGQILVHYLLQGQLVENISELDVDGDSTKEKIVSMNILGRASGGSYNTAIVKNNKVIFIVTEDNAGIYPADTNNGFYVEWRSPDDDGARCCPRGYMRTRFVYENNKFVPIYEQDVRYFKVGKKK